MKTIKIIWIIKEWKEEELMKLLDSLNILETWIIGTGSIDVDEWKDYKYFIKETIKTLTDEL